MTRKSFILLITIIALAIAGVLMITAQETDDTNTPPFGPGWMHNWDEDSFGFGMMHGGFGRGMMWGDGEPMMVDIAGTLGLEVDDLFTALRSGQSLAEIAEAQDVELDTVYDAMLTQAEEHMSVMVEAGVITQEQADEHLTWMRDNIATLPMFTGQMGYGMGMMHGGFGRNMMHGDFGRGMMGRRAGMRWNN